ncbi:para-nitrobenzyl esterase [Sphingomonas sp. UYAg733]
MVVSDTHEDRRGAREGDVTVAVASGLLRGRIDDGIAVFKGIPYGGDVSAARRWRRSNPVAPWAGVRDAVDYGPRAIQPESADMQVTTDLIEDLMGHGEPADGKWRRQSEECLTVSVWAPAPIEDRRLPVLFWCHGGKYFGETPPVWWFDGTDLARRENVVVVSVRHRVGALGFLHLADLPGGSAYEGASNVGMLDLVDALTWVRDNIAGFGGDPGNVTIFGESGGGLKVSVLLGMPAAAGLFHKAIIQSGSQLEAQSRKDGAANTLALMSELGLEPHDIDGLLSTPEEALVAAQIRLAPGLATRATKPRLEFEPVLDGSVLPEQALGLAGCAISATVPLLVGTNENETTFFFSGVPGVHEMGDGQFQGILGGMLGANAQRIIATYRASRPEASTSELFFAITRDFMFWRKAVGMAEQRIEASAAPVFMYLLGFATDIAGGSYGTPHILDLPLVFARPDHPILGSDPARYAVSRQMSGAWAAFARTGHPQTPMLPQWPAYDLATRATLVFAHEPNVQTDPRPEERVAW